MFQAIESKTSGTKADRFAKALCQGKGKSEEKGKGKGSSKGTRSGALKGGSSIAQAHHIWGLPKMDHLCAGLQRGLAKDWDLVNMT